ncbi:MAG: MEDS domain-containing protein [Syntrophobacteraceae bacterium]
MRKSHPFNPLERLLDVREAAEFLNVSEMTVRRWTNQGTLRCYRVGGKRERRFRLEDIQQYLAGWTGQKESIRVDLGFGGFAVPDGGHITHLYSDPAEAMDSGVSYIRKGLDNGETVLLVARPDRMKDLVEMLWRGDCKVEDFRSRGKLRLSEGMESPADQLEFISRICSSADGRFRLLGDMLWTRAKGWTLEALRSLEEAASSGAAVAGKLFLCQYPLDDISGREAMMALETHTHAITGGALRESPYFRPPRRT